MKGKVLVTDTLFIADEHVKQIEDAGYEVERLEKTEASEDELMEALEGKVGYIMGGIERITDKVVESANELKAIALTLSDWKLFAPGWEKAKAKGIMISNTPGANSQATAEFAVGMALLLQRNMLELGRTGNETFETTRSLQDANIGVIGAGNLGSKIISMVHAFSPAKVRYYNRSQKTDFNAEYVDLNTILKTSDVLFVALPTSAGMVLDKDAIENLKEDALVINMSPLNLMDMDALLVRLKAETLRAAIDWPAPSDEFLKLPLHTWFNTNDHAAFNTVSANRICSDMATQSLLNMLSNGEDNYRVI